MPAKWRARPFEPSQPCQRTAVYGTRLEVDRYSLHLERFDGRGCPMIDLPTCSRRFYAKGHVLRELDISVFETAVSFLALYSQARLMKTLTLGIILDTISSSFAPSVHLIVMFRYTCDSGYTWSSLTLTGDDIAIGSSPK